VEMNNEETNGGQKMNGGSWDSAELGYNEIEKVRRDGTIKCGNRRTGY
jgi:hypothetical protein